MAAAMTSTNSCNESGALDFSMRRMENRLRAWMHSKVLMPSRIVNTGELVRKSHSHHPGACFSTLHSDANLEELTRRVEVESEE